jgi:DNA modification methylase
MCIDQPYGDSYDPEWRLDAGVNKPWQTRAEKAAKNDDRVDWSAAYALFPGDVIYAWHAGIHAGEVAVGLHSQGFQIRAQIIWAKPSLVIGRGAYHWQHEPAYYAVRKGKPSHWTGDRKQSTVWHVENMHATQGNVDDGKTAHANQKPVELYRRPILNHTTAGDAVEDCFLGSGTCLIACELTDRICYGVEIDPGYTDMAVTRWQNLTKREARLHSTNQTFSEVRTERRPEAAAA